MLLTMNVTLNLKNNDNKNSFIKYAKIFFFFFDIKLGEFLYLIRYKNVTATLVLSICA